MNKAKVVQKAEAGEGLTVAEIKVYQKAVKPEKQVYGKYGTLAKRYLEDKGIDWTIANLPEYLHGVNNGGIGMKALKIVGTIGRFTLAGVLIIGHFVMSIIGALICAITSQG